MRRHRSERGEGDKMRLRDLLNTQGKLAQKRGGSGHIVAAARNLSLPPSRGKGPYGTLTAWTVKKSPSEQVPEISNVVSPGAAFLNISVHRLLAPGLILS